jgi:hypothetical protein
MRTSHLILLATTLAALISVCPSASAQKRNNCSVPSGYFRDNIGGCLHRYPNSVLQGLPLRWNECNKQCIRPDGAPAQSDKPPVYTLTTQSEVMATLECDFLAASKDARVRDVLSKAAITGSLTFTLVTKNSVGASLTVAAIPVFPSTSIAPSLDASRLTNTTESDKISISIDPAATSQCDHQSNNKWLTSKVMVDQFGQIRIDKIETEVSFVLTTQGSAGLKLNIVPVAIGPQLSGSYEHTQKLSLTFDFSKKPALASPRAANRGNETPPRKEAEQPPASQAQGTECIVNNPSERPMNVRETPRGAVRGTVDNGKHVRALRFDSADNGQPWAYVSDVDGGRELGWVFSPYLTCGSSR